MEMFDRMIAIRTAMEVAGFDGGRVKIFFHVQADSRIYSGRGQKRIDDYHSRQFFYL